MASTYPGGSRANGSVLSVSADLFRSGFDRRAFTYEHTLPTNPLFQLERLAEVVREVEPAGLVSYNGAEGGMEEGWDGLSRRPKRVESVQEALAQIGSAGAWVKITQLQQVSEYAQFLETLLDEISELLDRPIRSSITRLSVTVFISSPGAVTPFHMDHETNFFLQIRGRKTVNLFDGTDPEVVSPRELEVFYTLGNAQYRDDVGPRAQVYELGPGDGVHQPSCWPHWVKTGEEPWISLSMNFCLRERDLAARVHQCNHYLRRIGLQPTAPGRSRVRDGLKELVFASPLSLRPAVSMDEHLRGHLRRVERPLGALRWLRSRVTRRRVTE